MSDEEGLRERKKRETRQRISDHATYLFVRNGYDNVTVSEIAERANVAKMTVNNYFPRKEDLVLDRTDELDDLLAAAIRDRAVGTPFAVAVRDLVIDLVRQGHPLGSVRDGVQYFWRMVLDSPPLRRRNLELAALSEERLAAVIAEHSGVGADDPKPMLTAALLMSVYRTLTEIALRRLTAGESANAFRKAHLALVAESFDLVESGLAGYGA